MSEHEDIADDAQRDVEDLESRTERLGDDIERARDELTDPGDDSQLDEQVEGAVGDHPERSGEEPEAEGPPKGWA